MQLPPYTKYPILEGNRILLRQILASDLKDIVEISYYNAVQATSMKEVIEMQAKIEEDYLGGRSIHWGIADKLTDKIVGTCGYYRGFDNGEGELGCILLPQFHGHGYMTSAMELAIKFGLNKIGLKRIMAVTNHQNMAAIRLLERLNFHKVKDLNDQEIEYEL